MRERPIIFNSENVEAILDGRKTQTRRVMKPQPVRGRPWKDWIIDPEVIDLPVAYCPYGIARDRLWVRETWAVISFGVQRTCGVAYRADLTPENASSIISRDQRSGVDEIPRFARNDGRGGVKGGDWGRVYRGDWGGD